MSKKRRERCGSSVWRVAALLVVAVVLVVALAGAFYVGRW